jgi:hypothetical protein
MKCARATSEAQQQPCVFCFVAPSSVIVSVLGAVDCAVSAHNTPFSANFLPFVSSLSWNMKKFHYETTASLQRIKGVLFCPRLHQ